MSKLVYESLNEYRSSLGLDKDPRFSGRTYSGSYIPPQYRTETRQQAKQRIAKEKIEGNKAFLGRFASIQDLKVFKPQNNDWVLRSADGEGGIILFNGDLISEKEINELKSYYHYAEDLHYFQARPIKYKHWLDLSDKLKMASRRQKQ
jgi:hypothetical protein